MKKIILLLTISNVIFAQRNFDNDSILIWNSDRKINWNDFKSNDKKHSYEDAVAVITPSLIIIPKTLSQKDIPNIKIVATLHKNMSWYLNNEDYVLIHEQGHFDITEIFARKFRKKIFEAKNSEMKLDLVFITTLFESIDNEHWDFQSDYESETQNGTNYNFQKKWNEKIRNVLEELKDFESDVFIDEIK